MIEMIVYIENDSNTAFWSRFFLLWDRQIVDSIGNPVQPNITVLVDETMTPENATISQSAGLITVRW